MEDKYPGFVGDPQELWGNFVTIMVQLKKPNDNGIDEVDAVHSVDITDG